MPNSTLERLDPADLAYTACLAHVHTAGNSACSGQQDARTVAHLASEAGFAAALLTEHSGNPGSPQFVELESSSHRALRFSADAARDASRSTGFTLYSGLETNVVYTPDTGARIDVTDDVFEDLAPAYVIGSLHGDAKPYQDPDVALDAYRVLCESRWVDAIGHPTRNLPTHLIDWDAFFAMAAQTGTAVELNLNQWFKDTDQNKGIGFFSPGGERKHRRLMERGAASSASFLVGLDVHNEGMWPLPRKIQGWETTVDSLLRFNTLMADCGITPDRVVNSTLESFQHHLHLGRSS